jgi:hypothetical protein
MNKTKLEEMVEKTLNSMDGAERAAPAPFLLTRINARMNREQLSGWERISSFLSRPGIAIGAVAFLIIINLLIYTNSNSNKDFNSIQNMQASSDDYSISNPSAIFDFENIQP